MATPEEEARNHFMSTVKSLLTSGDYSDFTLICGSDVYKVHKAIIGPKSPVFAAKMTFGSEPADKDKMTLIDDELAIAKFMIAYLYEADYGLTLLKDSSLSMFPHSCLPVQDTYDGNHGYFVEYSVQAYCTTQICDHHRCGYQCGGSGCKDFVCNLCATFPGEEAAAQLIAHVKLYAIAEKYDILGLKRLAAAKFKECCKFFWDHKSFPEAANIAYETTPETDKGLRDIVVETISAHMQLLEKPEVEVLMTQFNGLAFDVLKRKSKEHGWC